MLFRYVRAKTIVKPASFTHVSQIANAAEVTLKLPHLQVKSCAIASLLCYHDRYKTKCLTHKWENSNFGCMPGGGHGACRNVV